MSYGVWVCRACTRVQVSELRHRTVGCRACGRRVDATEPAYRYRGVDGDEARRVSQRVSAQLSGLPIEDLARLVEAQERDRRGTPEDALAALADRVEFTEDEFAREAARLRVAGAPSALLDRLRAENRVFEPRPGRFRPL